MPATLIAQIMQELGLEIDDVRWHLSYVQAQRFLEYRNRLLELTRWVWSGQLEGELYDMEERYLEDLQQKLERNIVDEHQLRELFNSVAASKRKRSPG